MPRDTHNPMPVALLPFVVKNGSNICARFSTGIPHPLSEMVMRNTGKIRPIGGPENMNAELVTRFLKRIGCIDDNVREYLPQLSGKGVHHSRTVRGQQGSI
jgi:hypothetical protein